jgi:cell division septum initiation protein DivIVA
VEPVDVLYLLDQLEEVLGAGSRVPLTSRTLVDEPEILDIIDQIRLSIPEEIKAAKRLTDQRDQVIADANAEADRILHDADVQVAQRLSEHHLVRTAEARAGDIQDRALQQAADIRHEADAYAHRVLLKLREQIAQLGGTVDRGIGELEARGAHEDEQLADRV